MAKKLEGKVAVVTGASKGIGASIAKHLAKEGASVVVNYSTSQKEADAIVNEIKKSGGNAVSIQANLSKESEIKRLFEESKKAFGPIDILVNNAGVYAFVPLTEITAEHFHKIFDLNVLGLLLATREAAKHFGEKGGSVINISSIASTIARADTSVYSASKAAVDAITKSLSQELGSRNIRVNSINPGLIETEGVRSAGFDEGDFRDEVESKTPLGRIGQPDDVAPAAVFLASKDSEWISGITLTISGGLR